MPARTLVIGIPLPHVTFDNYSFASAPSISEYTRLIVEMSAVSRLVDEIIQGSAAHSTFAGQPVANSSTTAGAFGLSDLLDMRAREAAHFFSRGGAAVCIAHPDALHEGIDGRPRWRRYEWLPEPEGFHYQTDLLPGFGKPPVEASDPGHPFAPYADTYGKRMAYRAHVVDGPDAGHGLRVFARSAGGVAVGFDLPVGRGRIIFVPTLQDPDRDRTSVADTLFECFERLEAAQASGPADSMGKEGS